MQYIQVADNKQFAAKKLNKVNLFTSPRMFCDIYCFEPDQEQKLHSHDGEDKIYYVLEGTGRFTVGNETRDLGPGTAILVPPPEPHGVVNPGPERLILLVFMAPNPTP